jgi:hypothetical protein
MKLRTIDDPMVEAAARAMCAAEGIDPDGEYGVRIDQATQGRMPGAMKAWTQYRLLAFRILVASEARLLMMDD